MFDYIRIYNDNKLNVFFIEWFQISFSGYGSGSGSGSVQYYYSNLNLNWLYMIVGGVMVVLRFVDEQICIDFDVFVVVVPLALRINVNILFIVAIEKRWKNRKQRRVE